MCNNIFNSIDMFLSIAPGYETTGNTLDINQYLLPSNHWFLRNLVSVTVARELEYIIFSEGLPNLKMLMAGCHGH